MFEKLANLIMKRAKVIVAIWIVVLVASVPFIMRYNDVLAYDMTNMSSNTEMESLKGSEILSSGEFNSGSSLSAGTIILVVAHDSLASSVMSTMKDNLTNEFFFWSLNDQLREKGGLTCEVTVKQLGRFDDKYFEDTDTQMIVFSVVYPELPSGMDFKKSSKVPEIRSMVASAADGVDGIVDTYVTGTDAISYDTSSSSTNDIEHIDPISILLILILIGLFFRSFVTAGTPPVVIGMAYGILLSLVYFIGSLMGIYYITTILVLVSMLGAGCDYCIFIISRYREERLSGKDKEGALHEAIVWAGESIITSGISVIIGFGSLALCSFSLVSTMGIILALGIVLALLAALTFVPSLLMLAGDKIFWPSKLSSYKEGGKATKGWYGKISAFGHNYFTNSAKTSIKYAKVFVVAIIVLTVPLAYVVVTSDSSYDMISAMPPGEAKDGVAVISENIGGGMLMPTTVSMKVDAFVDLDVNGTLNSGDVVPSGGHVTVTATPATGYRVAGWMVDGSYTASTSDSYTWADSGLTDNPNVTAVFEKSTYDVLFQSSDDSMGTVSATVAGAKIVSGQSAYYGNELVFTASPADGYRVEYWTIVRDGTIEQVYSHENELLIGQAAYDYEVVANFGAIPTTHYSLSFSSTGNASIAARADGETVKSGVSLLENTNVVLSAILDEGYQVASWKVNGVEWSTGSTCEIYFLSENTEVILETVEKTVPAYTLKFSSNDTNMGTVTATVDGKAVESGTKVSSKSHIVITAVPTGDYVVNYWTYKFQNIPEIHIPILDIDVPLGDQEINSYTTKTQHEITNLLSDEEIVVNFGEKSSETMTVTVSPPSGTNIIALQNGSEIDSGSTVLKGSNILFVAGLEDGYHITKWTVTDSSGSTDINLSDQRITLYDLKDDTVVTCTVAPDDYLVFTYGANNDDYGSVTAVCKELRQPYVERVNAQSTFAALNSFANSLMELETDGKKNVALAIGPMNGDILFDSNHEWLLDTVAGILPSDFSKYVGTGLTYDALIAIWDKYVSYEYQELANYYLAYRMGFISKPFTEVEGGPEYQYVKFMIVTKDEPMSHLSVDTIKQVFDMKDDFVSEYSAEKTDGFVYEGYLSGAAVQNYEMSELVNKDFKFIIVVVIVALILLLFFVMRSYLTPIRAVFTIVMSVVWTLGLTYILFEHLLDTPVVWVVPIVLFVVCLGLGMDYDILLTTRIRENISKGMSNDDAIIHAVQKSGAIITLCGLIMAGAFGTMMVSTTPMLKEFGFALGFAIAIDALVIRTYVVPAIMHIMGDWNWKGPNYAAIKAKLLRKKPETE